MPGRASAFIIALFFTLPAWAETPEKAVAKLDADIVKCLEKRCSSLSLDKDFEAIPDSLATVPALKQLRLSRTKITDLAPISALTTLEWIDIGNTPITDISALKALPGLNEVILS